MKSHYQNGYYDGYRYTVIPFKMGYGNNFKELNEYGQGYAKGMEDQKFVEAAPTDEDLGIFGGFDG